jgi:hypothetical protein
VKSVAVVVASLVAVAVALAVAVAVARVRVRAVASAMKVAVVPVGREMTVAHLPSASFLATFLGSTTLYVHNFLNGISK